MSFMHYFHYSKVIRMTQHTKKHYWHLSFVVALLMSNALTASNAFKELCWENQLGYAQRILPERYHDCADFYIFIHNRPERIHVEGFLQVIRHLKNKPFPGEVITKIILMNWGNYFAIVQSENNRKRTQFYNDRFDHFIISDCTISTSRTARYWYLTIEEQKTKGDIDKLVQSLQHYFPSIEAKSIAKLKSQTTKFKQELTTLNWKKFYFKNFFIECPYITKPKKIRIKIKDNGDINQIANEFKTFFINQSSFTEAEISNLATTIENSIPADAKEYVFWKSDLEISNDFLQNCDTIAKKEVDEILKLNPLYPDLTKEDILDHKRQCEPIFSAKVDIPKALYINYTNSTTDNYSCFYDESFDGDTIILEKSTLVITDIKSQTIIAEMSFNARILNAHLTNEGILAVELIDESIYREHCMDYPFFAYVHNRHKPNPTYHRIEIYDLLTEKLLNIIKLPMREKYSYGYHLFNLSAINYKYIYLTNSAQSDGSVEIEYRSHDNSYQLKQFVEDIIKKKLGATDPSAQIGQNNLDLPTILAIPDNQLTIIQNSDNDENPPVLTQINIPIISPDNNNNDATLNPLVNTFNKIIPDPIIQNSDPFQQPPDNGQKFFQKLTTILKSFIIQNKKALFCAASGITILCVFYKLFQKFILKKTNFIF